MLIKTGPVVGLKAGPQDGLGEGEFVAYPSTFTRQPDSYGDVVAPGAFLNTIAAHEEAGDVMPGLYGHRMDDPDFYVAWANEMGEDEHGWWVKGTFDLETPKGKQVYRLVKGRRLNQLSFAFDVIDSAEVELDDGTKANELRELRVYEFSFVPVGANQDTSVVAVKTNLDALVEQVKVGRVLSAANLTSLQEAVERVQRVIDSQAAQSEDEAKASPVEPPKPEEPSRAKGEEAARSRSAEALVLATSALF